LTSAITWLEVQPEVDPNRIGIWGTSNGGAHAPYVAGVDDRVKAAVGQVGYGDGRRLIMDIRTPAEQHALEELLVAPTVLTGKGGAADCPTLLASLQTRAFFAEALKVVPDLYCEIPWKSAEATMEYRPIDVVDRISPRALLLIGAEKTTSVSSRATGRFTRRRASRRSSSACRSRTTRSIKPEWVAKSAKLAIECFDRYLKG
jgi:uncharacterized protein